MPRETSTNLLTVS